MDRKPMATIIIPVYNAQAYLEKCLDSAYSRPMTIMRSYV